MKTRDIREAFFKFFEQREHVRRPSASLIPAYDPTLLFTSAGMAQFKDFFLGKGEIPFPRVVTSQRCLRTGDIENVGRTAAHHTFFEMLGTFSFNDYFRLKAIVWAWEFLLEALGIDESRLSVSVYEEDQDAYDIWKDEIGVPAGKIYRLGQKGNFWPSNAPIDGPNGPCGPCSEIFYDQGEQTGCGSPDCNPDCDCDRYVEIWNLVFTQFDRRDGGVLEPLGRNNVDTGMGLERIAAVMQGKKTNYEIDIFVPLIQNVCELLGLQYEHGTEAGARVRRIADHSRALATCIADKIMPSNEGRGYVLRRLLRRAACDGRRLGATEPFLHRMSDPVIETLGDFIPELVERRDAIKRVILHEEETFGSTLNQGLRLIENLVDRLKSEGKTVLRGDEAFKLYDTHGFPLELTESILEEHNIGIDREGFERSLDEQGERARAASMFGGEVFAANSIEGLADRATPTLFTGYDKFTGEGEIRAVIRGEALADRADPGDRVALVLDTTPFYARSGGQVGDTGFIRAEGFEFRVEDTIPADGYYLHHGQVTKGTAEAGMKVTTVVDSGRRADTAANHTATHVLHWALRNVLGTHVAQAGSEVSAERLRFDFSHIGAVKDDELEKIEQLANERIMEGSAVSVTETALDAAKQAGALALFDEKYGERVRMVSIGDFSRELCGGTHVENLADIGLLKIIGEEAVASGIRRITAVTRLKAYTEFKNREKTLLRSASELNTQPDMLAEKVAALAADSKQLRKEVQGLRAREAMNGVRDLLAGAETVGSARIVAAVVTGMGRDELRKVSNSLAKENEDLAVVLGAEVDGKAAIAASCGTAAVKLGLKAGDIARAAAQVVGGGGGGRPQSAQAGGPDASRLDEAMRVAAQVMKNKLAGTE